MNKKHEIKVMGKRLVRWVGDKRGANKQIRQGSTRLIAKNDWCNLKEIQGCDPDVLYSATIEKGFNRIVEDFKPRNKIAIVSLCTATRPYSLSRKWFVYNKLFAHKADLIISSNGGVIPIEYEDSFPYLNYDAHGEKKYDKQYIEVGVKRFLTFFKKHNYRYVLFNFRHKMRNIKIAHAVIPELIKTGAIKEAAILPTKEHYLLSQKEGFAKKGFSMFPELYPTMLNPVIEIVNKWSSEK